MSRPPSGMCDVLNLVFKELPAVQKKLSENLQSATCLASAHNLPGDHGAQIYPGVLIGESSLR